MPKYRALTGRVDGLSPAAVSTLIGKNPLSRPPEAPCLRFVEACLRYREWPDPEEEIARWAERWRLLDGDVPPDPQPAIGAEICQSLSKNRQTDGRTGQVWQEVYQCSNQPTTVLYQRPDAGSTRVGMMDSRQSWFACWVRGERHDGGNDVWYYTRGDRSVEKPELEGWGFMPASRLLTDRHPNPGVERQCPSIK